MGDLKYGEFEFPSDRGFSGSAGKKNVKGYMRGGKVSSTHEPTNKNPDHTKGKGRSKAGMPGANKKRASGGVKAKGGRVGYQMGGYTGDAPGQQKMGFQGGGDREIQVDGVGITVPRKKGGRAKPKSTHDKLMAHGKKMGYAQGGYATAKDTSGEFKAKRGPQDTMDTGNQPARRGRTEAEREAGGTKRLKPGLKKGGKVAVQNKSGKSNRAKAMAKPTTPAAKGGAIRRPRLRGKHVGGPDAASEYPPSKARQTMPKGVKARGGLAKYAKGGYAAGDKKTHPTGKGRKPYTGYNKQPGGSGNEDARYMNPVGKRGAARSR
jgi:hypothetical protein